MKNTALLTKPQRVGRKNSAKCPGPDMRMEAAWVGKLMTSWVAGE